MLHTHKRTFAQRFLRSFPPPSFLLRPSVGFDISDTSVRVVELRQTKKGLRLGKHAAHTIPEGLMVNGKIEKFEEVAAEFKKIRQKLGLQFIRVSLPEEHAYLFQTTVPTVSQEGGSLRSTLEFQLEEHVPIPPSEAVFDYEILEKYGDEMKLNIAVYAKEIIAPYIEVLHSAGLTPLSFEIEAMALARAVTPNDEASYMIVDFGRKRTGIAVISDGALRFTSTVNVGGDTLSAAIRKHIDLPEDEITKLKNEQGITGVNKNTEMAISLLAAVSALKDEIQRHYLYWNTRTGTRKGAQKIEKIILCGGSSNLAGLPEYLAFNLGAPVELANAWLNVMSFDEAIPPIHRRKSLGYAGAIGLALHDHHS